MIIAKNELFSRENELLAVGEGRGGGGLVGRRTNIWLVGGTPPSPSWKNSETVRGLYQVLTAQPAF